MRGSNTEIFDGKDLKSLFYDIYNNSVTTKTEIRELIKEMSGLVRTPEDVLVVTPAIQGLLEVEVKNDEQMVKLATIVQRMITAESYSKTGPGDAGELLTDEEKEQLLRNTARQIVEDAREIASEVEEIKKPIKLVQ